MTPDADLLIIGGGPVGLAAAIEGRLAGLSVIVVEPRATPVDKACGEGLMPGAVAALARLGVDPQGHTLTGIRYLRGAHTADDECVSHGPPSRAGRGRPAAAPAAGCDCGRGTRPRPRRRRR